MSKRSKVPTRQAEVVRLFAQRLREARRQRGMTQAELALRAKLSETYVSRLESAGGTPGIDLADRLAKALGVGLAELLPAGEAGEPLAVFKEEARRLFEALLRTGDRDTFVLLNPLLALLVEAAGRRG